MEKFDEEHDEEYDVDVLCNCGNKVKDGEDFCGECI
jgi:hypothetical protein